MRDDHPLLPAHPAERPPAPARALPLRRTPPARWSASAASARAPGSCCCSAATTTTRCSCRSRRPQASVLEPFLGKSKLRQPRPARRRGPAADAGRQRHLARLDHGRPGSTASSATSTSASCGTARAPRSSTRWSLDALAAYARDLRLDAGPRARPLRRPRRDRRLPRLAATSFDRAMATFAEAYADQNERDYAALREAAESGRVAAETGL